MFVYMYVSHIHVMCLDTKAYIARFGNRTNVLQHGYTCVRDRKIDIYSRPKTFGFGLLQTM